VNADGERELQAREQHGVHGGDSPGPRELGSAYSGPDDSCKERLWEAARSLNAGVYFASCREVN
jgi:hypothetical protein